MEILRFCFLGELRERLVYTAPQQATAQHHGCFWNGGFDTWIHFSLLACLFGIGKGREIKANAFQFYFST